MRSGRSLPLQDVAHCLLQVPALPGRIRWSDALGNDRPVELEVGPGKGEFLVTWAKDNPERNIVGLEVLGDRARYIASRITRRHLQNARILKTDAAAFLRDSVEDASVAAIHVYFPDPWWKKKHHKRRLLSPVFVRRCVEVLQPGGLILFASDVEEAFVFGLRALCNDPGLEPIPDYARSQASLSNFERKAKKKGRSSFDAAFRKIVRTPCAPGDSAVGASDAK